MRLNDVLDRGLRFGLAMMLAVPLYLFGGPSTAMAAATFEGGVDQLPLNTSPIYVLNDHTPVALHYSATGLEPGMTYNVKMRFTVGTGPSGATNRGWTYNAVSNEWVQEREADWKKFPAVTADASGTISNNNGWVYAAFGDEKIDTTSDYHLLISLNASGSAGTFNASVAPTVTVLPAATAGNWVHNGTAPPAGAAGKRAEATMSTTSTVCYALQKSEPNLLDDDFNGVVDDEDYGLPGKTTDFRLGVPMSTPLDVYLNRVLWGPSNDFSNSVPDVDIALGAADVTAPTAVSLMATSTTDGKVSLEWTSATDNTAVTGYRVYRWLDAPIGAQYTNPHRLIATVPASEQWMLDTTAVDGTLYNYEVRAVDASTNAGPRSNAVAALSDGVAPSVATIPDATFYNSAKLTVSATDTGTGVAFVSYELDGGATVTLPGGETPVDVPDLGEHELTYWATDFASNVSEKKTVNFTIVETTGQSERIGGAGRFDTAALAAKTAFPDWTGVDTVVVACGDDRAASDPLAASGLAGAYNAPLLLVSSTSVPKATSNAIAEMPAGVDVIVVGGTGSVPSSVATALGKIATVDAVTRISGNNRYDTAAKVARAMKTKLGPGMPTTALIANGADSRSFGDALSLSPIASAQHYPLLLVAANSVPSETSAALRDLGLTTRYIAGGTSVVSAGVASKLGVPAGNRMSGKDRFATSVAVARRAISEGWNDGHTIGVAAKAADALAGGVALGAVGGVLVLTPSGSLDSGVRNLISENVGEMLNLYIFGGTQSVTPAVQNAINALFVI